MHYVKTQVIFIELQNNRYNNNISDSFLINLVEILSNSEQSTLKKQFNLCLTGFFKINRNKPFEIDAIIPTISIVDKKKSKGDRNNPLLFLRLLAATLTFGETICTPITTLT
jgi:hypothetical protein